jgi:hypothetical protein
MEYSFYDFLKLLGSLALFLYGMKIMSEGLQKFAGDRLRTILTAMTTYLQVYLLLLWSNLPQLPRLWW